MATTKATTLAHTLGGISSDISTAEINRLDGVTGDLQTQLDAKAPLASPDFTGTVDLTGTTLSLDNDQISGDKVSGGTIGAGTFDGTIGNSAVLSDSYYLQAKLNANHTSGLPTNINFDESTSPYWVFTSDSDWHVSGTGSNFSQGTTASDLKIHRAGIYLVNCSISGYETFAERNINIEIRGVGSGSSTILARSLDNIAIAETGTNYGNAFATLIYKFNANDQINFYISSRSQYSANMYETTHFNICLIRPL